MVARGVPFREAHAQVAQSFTVSELAPATTLTGNSSSNSPAPHSSPIDPLQVVGLRSSPGGPAPDAVDHQTEHARARLTAHRASISSLGRKVAYIEELLKEETK
jgi:argininosuccinate lyase